MRLFLALTMTMFVSLPAMAHDGGHGPKLTDSPKQGGDVSPVIDAKEAKLGAKAAIVYKAELVRLDDGGVRVYLYDQNMKPLNIGGFAKQAQGTLEIEKKGKVTRTPFTLQAEGNFFAGKAPKPESKPYNIDITVKESAKDLLAAFDNLD